MQVGPILVFVGWLIRDSFQLACIQCTSPIRRVSSIWDHSCLDGTLPPVPCEQSNNQTKLHFKNCLSALYKLTARKKGGVHIHRGCSMIENVRHECDPPASTFNIDKISDFFCSRTCSEDGCNQHSVNEITSNANRFSNRNVISFVLWTHACLFLIK